MELNMLIIIFILMGVCFFAGREWAIGDNKKMADHMIRELEKEGIITIDNEDQIYAGHKTKEWAKAWNK